jgi:hypothetical protein
VRALAIALIALFTATAAQADEAMTKAATDFYTATRSAGSGLPDAAARARLAPLMTPALQQLFASAAATEDHFTSTHKNLPPLVEGDIYSSLFEGPTQFSVGACTGDAAKATCPIALTYSDKSGITRWTDTLYLASTAGGWKVDDIAYGGNWDFGNKGKLSDTLRQVAGFASSGP